jgi:hypothetical protein
MRMFLLSASLAGLLLTGVSLRAHPTSSAKVGQESEPATKTVTGKIASIGNGGTSFTLEVNGSDAKQTMQFVLDKNAKVQGNVKVGTPVTVQYEAKEEGQNLAVAVIAQG